MFFSVARKMNLSEILTIENVDFNLIIDLKEQRVIFDRVQSYQIDYFS